MENDERIVKALRRIKRGQWMVRRAAKFAGLAYRELLDKMAEEGIDSGPTLKDLRESLKVPSKNNRDVIRRQLKRGSKLTELVAGTLLQKNG